MLDGSLVSARCYLHLNNKKGEQRRIDIPYHVSFSGLKGHLRRAFPDLHDEDFSITEIEDSGVEIPISDDGDLSATLRYHTVQKDSGLVLEIRRIGQFGRKAGELMTKMAEHLQKTNEKQHQMTDVLQHVGEQQQFLTALVQRGTDLLQIKQWLVTRQQEPQMEKDALSHLMDHMKQVLEVTNELHKSFERLNHSTKDQQKMTTELHSTGQGVAHAIKLIEHDQQKLDERKKLGLEKIEKENSDWQKHVETMEKYPSLLEKMEELQISSKTNGAYAKALEVDCPFSSDTLGVTCFFLAVSEKAQKIDVPRDVNFSCLKGYLRRVFPKLRGEDFDVFLSDGSASSAFKITLSSDEDWIAALRHNKTVQFILHIENCGGLAKQIGESLQGINELWQKTMKQQRLSSALLPSTNDQQQATIDVVQRSAQVLNVKSAEFLEWQIMKQKAFQFTKNGAVHDTVHWVKHMELIERLTGLLRESIILLCGANHLQKETIREILKTNQLLARAAEFLQHEQNKLEQQQKDQAKLVERESFEWEKHVEQIARTRSRMNGSSADAIWDQQRVASIQPHSHTVPGTSRPAPIKQHDLADQPEAVSRFAMPIQADRLPIRRSAKLVVKEPRKAGTREPFRLVDAPCSEAKINAALDRMFAMGFNNKDGWLTKLLVEKGGDIGKVLDILQPF